MVKKATKKTSNKVSPSKSIFACFLVDLFITLIVCAIYLALHFYLWDEKWWDEHKFKSLLFVSYLSYGLNGLWRCNSSILYALLYLLGYFVVVIGCGMGTGNSYRGHRREPVERLQLIASIVLFAVLVTISVWYYKTKSYTSAFWWNWSFLWTSVYVAKYFCVMGGACPRCKILGVKKLVGSDERKGTATGYVAPGYETVTADIKDESGNKVGTVEAKVHRDGYSYEYNTKTVVRHYHCENCGYDFSES